MSARARVLRRAIIDIGRIFSTEAVVLALAGWALRMLLGWLIYQGLLTLVRHEADLSLPHDFQPTIPLITLVGVLVLTLTASADHPDPAGHRPALPVTQAAN